jgi:hypothetical protein
MILDERTRLWTRWGALKRERSSWETSWRELSAFILPRQGRFFINDRNRGEKRNGNIYDNTATRAVNTLAAGMMAGMTSPARPWFMLQTPDEDLNESPAVKLWLTQVRDKMLKVFAMSNTYMTLHAMYKELGVFGTSATFIMDDFDNVIHHYAVPIGEYAIATDYKGRTNTFAREFQKTVDELVREFGYDKCSTTVQQLYDNNGGGKDQWITIVHMVQPNDDYQEGKLGPRGKKFRSVYFELERPDHGQFLRQSGFDKFRALVPRWDKTGGDTYGMSPGMEAIGDIKQLQHEQLRKASVIDYQTKPPIVAPTSMKNQPNDFLPGGVSFSDNPNPVKEAWQVNLRLDYLLADIQDVRMRIENAFYSDVFRMISSMDKTGMTATEVALRNEEKMTLLGPVLERLHHELLSPLIEITFDRLLETGALPPPPPELEGMELDVQFVSVLAQAQRAIGVNSVDRYVGAIGAVAQFKPEVLDRLDADQWADSYAEALGIDPRLIVPLDVAQQAREQRAQEAAQAAAAERANLAAETASKLGTVEMADGSNAGQDLINQFSGYGSPSAVEAGL